MPSSAEVEISNEQAGFLLALGLNGHLKKLAVHHLHSYLSKVREPVATLYRTSTTIQAHEMTTIGLLIGLAAARCSPSLPLFPPTNSSRRGTMDLEVTRILSVHIPALLPAGSTQLNVPSLAQVAALIGLGLVYQGSAHRHITQVLLADIGTSAKFVSNRLLFFNLFSRTSGWAGTRAFEQSGVVRFGGGTRSGNGYTWGECTC